MCRKCVEKSIETLKFGYPNGYPDLQGFSLCRPTGRAVKLGVQTPCSKCRDPLSGDILLVLDVFSGRSEGTVVLDVILTL